MGSNKNSIDPKAGQVFGYLTVICEVEPHIQPNGYKKRQSMCICKCGKKVITGLNSLKRRPNANCGCRRSEKGLHSVKHGLSRHPIRERWDAMKARCYNKNFKFYKDYGGRGITVCTKWREDFISFYNWAVSNGWDKCLELDRIDNNGNYEPSNCRWVTKKQNCNNRRTSVKFEYDGVYLTLTEIARLNNIEWGTLYRRVKYYGMSLTEAIIKKDYRSNPRK